MERQTLRRNDFQQAAATILLLTLLLLWQEEDEPEIGAQGDPRGSVGAAVQEGLWLLWQSCLAGLLLQVLEGGIPQGQAEADSRGLGAGRAVKNLLSSFRVTPPNPIPVSSLLRFITNSPV